MSIALLVITDGRLDYLERTVESAERMLHGPITEAWMYDDTGDKAHRSMLGDRFPHFRHINAGPRQGFGGAIRSAWDHLSTGSDARFVFHLEGDFTFNRAVPLAQMAYTLDTNPDLVQLALRRQPWNEAERRAGGVVELNPEAYTDRSVGGAQWLEQRIFFTTNPSLYRLDLCRKGWPHGARSEGKFSHQILDRFPESVFGYWGSRGSGEWVTHIGEERAGVGY